MESIVSSIRVIPDYPIPGVLFRDITTLLKDPMAFKQTIDALVANFAHKGVDKVAGIESRGFIFGASVAERLGVGFVPVRKKGKLPCQTVSQSYALEYGVDTIEIHADAFMPGEKVLIIDDLIATGGTALAACQLVEKMQAQVLGCGFVIDLVDLGGQKKLTDAGFPVFALCSFAD
jgi:adenine phosphoribosyltransferase